jgi:hypothetical protein
MCQCHDLALSLFFEIKKLFKHNNNAQLQLQCNGWTIGIGMICPSSIKLKARNLRDVKRKKKCGFLQQFLAQVMVKRQTLALCSFRKQKNHFFS